MIIEPDEGEFSLHPRNFPELVIGPSLISRTVDAIRDAPGLRYYLIERIEENALDASALLDLSQILIARGERDYGLHIQKQAISLRRDFRIVHGNGTGLRILAFVAKGDAAANIPIDFLLHGSNCILWLCYVDARTQDLRDVPPHDVAMVAIADVAANMPVLTRLKGLLGSWKTPILNNCFSVPPRNGRRHAFCTSPEIVLAQTVQLTRSELLSVANEQMDLSKIVLNLTFPVIVKPIGDERQQLGRQMGNPRELLRFLVTELNDEFDVSPFVDFRGADGLYAKYSVMFVGGKPFPLEMVLWDDSLIQFAVEASNQTIDIRLREAGWAGTFHRNFAIRHADAFAALNGSLNLDYFGIDCAELPDGRLLVFRIGNAVSVHDMDSAARPASRSLCARNIFAAFLAMAADRASTGAEYSG